MLIKNVHAIEASSYAVMNMDNNQTILSNNKDTPRLIASITKIMTCIIAIENGNLKDKITANESILETIGSSLYIEVDETLTLEDLLYGLMLKSGNDAAIMIANYISGSMDEFAKIMNSYAKKIGMGNTIFYNSHGLENNKGIGNLSTAYDMALLTSYAYNNQIFRKIFSTKKYTVKSNKKSYSWTNKNKLLKYDYITGGKTGYTIKAKRTLVSTALINNMNIVIVTLNDPDDWHDHIELYNNIKENYIYKELIKKESLNYINNDRVKYKINILNNFKYCIKKNQLNDIKIIYYLNDDYDSFESGIIGHLDVYLKNNLIYSDKIYFRKTKESFFTRIKRLFKKV